jgi:protein SCO1/2
MQRALILVCLWLLSPMLHAAGEVKLVSGVFDPPREAPEIDLQGSHGKPLHLSDYRGKVVVLGFGFTSCPDVCPTTLAVLAQALKKVGPLADQVQVVYITVDPQRDTAEQMRKYLGTFNPTFIGGTGSEAALEAVRKQYGILANKQTYGSNYTFAHSSYVYLIDRSGMLRALAPYGQSADDFAHDIKLLLAER